MSTLDIISPPHVFWSIADDPELAFSSSGRDPFGLQPLWSGLGRLIVPHLATTVSQYRGLLAVMLGYEVAALLKVPKLRRFFYDWEALVECHWYLQEMPVLYGIQYLSANLEREPLKANSNSTILRKGLWQYYRGTCRRLGYLSSNGSQLGSQRLPWPKNELDEIVRKFTPAMQPQLATTLLKVMAKSLEKPLLKIWDNHAIKQHLTASLIEGPANQLGKIWVNQWRKEPEIEDWKQLYAHFSNATLQSPEGILQERLSLCLRADPWFSVIAQMEDWLSERHEKTMNALQSSLRSERFEDIRAKAQNFPAWDELQAAASRSPSNSLGTLMERRWLVLKELAEALNQNNLPKFLAGLIQYHQRETPREKWKWIIENSKVLAVNPGQSNLRIDPERGYADYYLGTIKRIVDQLG